MNEKGKKTKKAVNLRSRNGAIYVGETSRSLYERSGEHWDDSKKRDEESHIWKHWQNVHGGIGKPEFKFKLIRSFRDCLSRQVSECVRVQLRGDVLNSKAVYSRCKLPRLVIEEDSEEEREITDKGSGGKDEIEMGKLEEMMEHQRDGNMRLSKRGGEMTQEEMTRPRKRFRKAPEDDKDVWGEIGF